MQSGQHHTVGVNKPDKKLRPWIYIGILVLTALAVAFAIWWSVQQTPEQMVQSEPPIEQAVQDQPLVVPKIATEVVLGGREHIWDIGFLPTKEMIFTERGGKISAFVDGQVRELANVDDVKVGGEGGLLGLAIDPDFANNRLIYTCYDSTSGDVRVVKFKINDQLNGLQGKTDVVTGIPANPSGRHSGCRVAFGLDGYLWVATGDAAMNGTIPQDPESLGGKILRVDREGNAAPGNLGGEFDARIFSYGHRNSQGLAFFSEPINGIQGISVEHGSYQDDELNPLLPGNFGWSPGAGYNELGVPMTDKSRFTDAVSAIWSSGETTIAPSGAAILQGQNWGLWQGRVAVSVLKDKHVRLFELDKDLKLVSELELFKNEFGRLRAATLGPDNALYISTSNGNDDKIIRVFTTD
ncbi:MAG TPA: PQQ-dependent sugar dehydrogenase [Candidatus Saccharimonadales bacterium]|nr:PQQ-dependent sugar dehydrogenase [Candidatus Saccharimonadales bacterium]